MAVTPSYLGWVVEQLSGLGAVTPKRMFGGIGLYYDDWFFGLIDDDVVFFGVDEDSRNEYVGRGMPPFQPVASKPQMISKNYYQVPGEVLDDADELVVWARRALEATRAKAVAKRARKSAAAKQSAPKRPAKTPSKKRAPARRKAARTSPGRRGVAPKRSPPRR